MKRQGPANENPFESRRPTGADSEIERINNSRGTPVSASPETVLLVGLALQAARETRVPLFEIRTDVASAGVRICVVGGDAGMVEDARARLIELAGRWSATGADSEIKRTVNPSFGTVAIPPGTDLDLREVARGLAADLVVADILDAGAYGVCVDVGGHIRAAGAAPSRAGWLLRLDHSLASETVGDVRLRAGAVGTSARPAPGQRGFRQRAGVVAVTVVAAIARQAATIALAAIRAGCPGGATLVGRAGGAGLFSFADGTHQSTARWPDFVA